MPEKPEKSSRKKKQPEAEGKDPPQERGALADERQKISDRLNAYRKANGLSCLAPLARKCCKEITDDLLRDVIIGAKMLSIAQWREVNKALDALESKT